jgi:hypothetical protein
MGKVIASITTSIDGYVTGPDDGPECGLGRGGERLHYWVMGGPWTYEGGRDLAMHGPDKEFYDELVSSVASGVVGRGMYDAAGAWGGTNPFPGVLFVPHSPHRGRTGPHQRFPVRRGPGGGACAGDRGGAGPRYSRRRRRERHPAGAGGTESTRSPCRPLR